MANPIEINHRNEPIISILSTNTTLNNNAIITYTIEITP
jgi:hypothetical protein